MKPHHHNAGSQEIELKLALPTSDSSTLARRLSRTSVLARRKSTVQHLHNIYFDTPDQHLNQHRVVLRLRRVGSDAKPQWLQTLKTGDRSDSALSQRGEWEMPVPGATLVLQALKATPWSAIDPDGSVFGALKPSFVTVFDRTIWLVRRRDGSVVEVALDIGQIEAGGKITPICELELELKTGQPVALFDVARQIAHTLAVLPASKSKAERGYALARNDLNAPVYAQAQGLSAKMSLHQTAQRVLREMFGQFTGNLNALCSSEDPQVVHQARIAWRRFKSASRLFRPVIAKEAAPSWSALQVLLACLGELRDFDVALAETLPPLAETYIAGDPRRDQAWQLMLQALEHAAELQRKAVRYALQDPAVGLCLLATTQWLEALASKKGGAETKVEPKMTLRHWAKRRMSRQREQFKQALHEVDSPTSLHHVRILAKRMRYSIEAIAPVLPKRQRHWYRQATKLQASIGATRDVVQASVLLARLEVDRGLVEFLRGVACGQTLNR